MEGLNMKTNNLPKAELHCHLDGSIRPETILELAQEENIYLPTTDLEEFKKLVQVPSDCSSLKEYLEKFSLPILVMQKSGNIKRITKELIEDCKKDGVNYIEIRFAPLLHTEHGLTFEEIVESVLNGMEEGYKEFGVRSNLILCCMRHMSPSSAAEVIEKGRKYLDHGVVAVDLAGNEHDFPPEIFEEPFALAKEYGYHITIHAGETGIPENIINSIDILNAERIGHGVYAFANKDIYNQLKEKNIPLELCPTSNIHTQVVSEYKDHPFNDYYENGIYVTFSTDNRTVSNTTMSEEAEHLRNAFNYSDEDYINFYKKTIEASFASEEIKSELLNKL